jgi:leucyl-tRNA synthetase
LYDINLLKQTFIDIPIQINGKIKCKVQIHINDDEPTVKEFVFSNKQVITFLQNKQITKFIYIKNKIVTIVAK